MSEQVVAAWYPDPFGRYEARYFDGTSWTPHVRTRGHQAVDSPAPSPATPQSSSASTTSAAATSGAWHPDPSGRHELRYWDGSRWSDHVLNRGLPGIDPLSSPASTERSAPVQKPSRTSLKVQRQIAAYGLPDRTAIDDAALFTAPVLVVNQKAKVFGLNTEYAVYDEHGQRIGTVREVGQRLIKKAAGGGGVHGTHKFQVVDPDGSILLTLNRPAKLVKSRMTMVSANGTSGEIVQKTLGVVGKVQFSLESGGHAVGSINAEDRRAWDFSIRDVDGGEIARITKTWAGWAKERFTKADNYVVQIHRPLDEPLRSLTIAAALAIDTALKQGAPTSRLSGTRRYQ